MMKNFYVTFLFILANFVFSQNSGFAIKAGLQTTGMTKAEFGDNQNRFGFYVGISKEFEINSEFKFQPEVLYSYQSFRNANVNIAEIADIINPEEVYPNFNQEYNSHFIKVPLMMKYQPNKFYVEIGPEIGLQLQTTLKIEDLNGLIPSGKDKLEHINKFQIAAMIGSGYQINERFDLGMRFGWGFKELTEYNYIKNFNISLGVSYRL